MFVYKDNEQAKREYKNKAAECNIKLAKVAEICNITPQRLNNRLNTKRLALSDLKEFCERSFIKTKNINFEGK